MVHGYYNFYFSLLLSRGMYTSLLMYCPHCCQRTARALPHLEEDARLLPMLAGLSKRYLGSEYNLKKTNVGQVTADMIDMVRLSFKS